MRDKYNTLDNKEKEKIVKKLETEYHEKHSDISHDTYHKEDSVLPTMNEKEVEIVEKISNDNKRKFDNFDYSNDENQSSPVSHMIRELKQEITMKKDNKYVENLKFLNAKFVLDKLEKDYGLNPSKYEITSSKDGTQDRIKSGSRNLNVTDFMTKEMNLSWTESKSKLQEYKKEFNELEQEFREYYEGETYETRKASVSANSKSIEEKKRTLDLGVFIDKHITPFIDVVDISCIKYKDDNNTMKLNLADNIKTSDIKSVLKKENAYYKNWERGRGGENIYFSLNENSKSRILWLDDIPDELVQTNMTTIKTSENSRQAFIKLDREVSKDEMQLLKRFYVENVEADKVAQSYTQPMRLPYFQNLKPKHIEGNKGFEVYLEMESEHILDVDATLIMIADNEMVEKNERLKNGFSENILLNETMVSMMQSQKRMQKERDDAVIINIREDVRGVESFQSINQKMRNKFVDKGNRLRNYVNHSYFKTVIQAKKRDLNEDEKIYFDKFSEHLTIAREIANYGKENMSDNPFRSLIKRFDRKSERVSNHKILEEVIKSYDAYKPDYYFRIPPRKLLDREGVRKYLLKDSLEKNNESVVDYTFAKYMMNHRYTDEEVVEFIQEQREDIDKKKGNYLNRTVEKARDKSIFSNEDAEELKNRDIEHNNIEVLKIYQDSNQNTKKSSSSSSSHRQ